MIALGGIFIVKEKKVKDKSAILVVSFGTSFDDTREKNITKLENLIKETYPDFHVECAFTSGIIMKVLKDRGISVLSVQEAMDKLKKEGFSKVFVQPTHLIPGDEYDKLCKAVKLYNSDFESIEIGIPLLYTPEDCKRVLKSVFSAFPLSDDTGLVLMGHGSAHFANCIYPAMNYMCTSENLKNVFIATVEGFPELDDIIPQIEAAKLKKLYVTPLMLVAGDHATNDMAGDDDSWKNILESKGFEVECTVKGLGEYDEVCDLYLEHLSKLLKRQ